MSTETLPPPVIPHVVPSNLNDVADYAAAESLPAVPWLTQLRDQADRVDLHSIGTMTRVLKRIADLVIATAMLIVLAPVLLLTALAVTFTTYTLLEQQEDENFQTAVSSCYF